MGQLTWNIAQYPLHHATYAPAKFEIAMSNGKEDAITRKYIIWHLDLISGPRPHKTLPSTLYII